MRQKRFCSIAESFFFVCMSMCAIVMCWYVRFCSKITLTARSSQNSVIHYLNHALHTQREREGEDEKSTEYMEHWLTSVQQT